MSVLDRWDASLSRTLGLLSFTGGLVALVWSVLPREPDQADDVVVAMALLALLIGAGLVRAGGRLSGRLLHAALGVIQVLIGTAYLAVGDPSCDLRLFFLWSTLYAALHFRVRTAVMHLAWMSSVIVASLTLMPAATRSGAVGVALMLLGTLVATGTLAASAATALRRAEAAQRHQASRDPLTGLANRRRLLDVLRDGTAPSTGAARALVLLDLDGLKAVNARYGHAEGDALLQAIARQLTSSVRTDDLVCRLGGDEFALVVHGLTGPQDALDLAMRVTAAAAEVRSGRRRRGSSVVASAGVRMLEDGDLDASAALRDADAALYVSKREGCARPHLWSAGMRHDGVEQQELADDLRHGLHAGQLHLVYQPVVDIDTLRVRGIEVLARWRHPERGDVPPDQFVPCAERSGLVGELTQWVLRTACRQATTWPTASDGARLNLAVNISAVQLADLAVVEDVRAALAESGLSPGDLVLEVTETAAVVDLATARRTLERLAGLGVHLALDDFGTGHSSLSHVHALPFHILKVDRSFVAACVGGDRRASATIAAVGALAAQIHVDVVAEGVEDRDQLPALRALGCRYAQGFGLSRPLSPAVLTAALAAQPDGWVLAPSRTRAPVGVSA